MKDHPKKSNNPFIPSSEFYRQIINSLQDYAIFTIDNDLHINSWSTGSTTLFAYEEGEVLGEHFDIIFTEEDKKNGTPMKEIEKALTEGRAIDNRWHVTKSGNKFYAYGWVFPLIDADGKRIGFAKILRDLTEKKKAEDAIKQYVADLEELNTHKESVLAILSHDLRSPLSAIIATTKYLSSHFEKMKQDRVKEMLEQLHKSATDELDMLDYLVEWARIKYASEVFSPSEIKLVEYVEKVFDSLNDVASVNGVNLHHEIKEKENIFADGKMLLSILHNLVSNALKHTNPGGEVIIRSKRKGKKMVVEVKDSGMGMSKDIMSTLFTPKVASLSAARKKNKGAGIGLLLVKGFLEKNSGEIWVESIEGNGSSFYFTLPIKPPKDMRENLEILEDNV